MPMKMRDTAFSSAASEKLRYDRSTGSASSHLLPAGSVLLQAVKLYSVLAEELLQDFCCDTAFDRRGRSRGPAWDTSAEAVSTSDLRPYGGLPSVPPNRIAVTGRQKL